MLKQIIFKNIIPTAWCKINHNEMHKNTSKQIIWNNSNIESSKTFLYYKQCQEKSIKYYNTYTITDQINFITLKNCKMYKTNLIKVFKNNTTLLITFIKTERYSVKMITHLHRN